jgi:excisionase family DNA binding protein
MWTPPAHGPTDSAARTAQTVGPSRLPLGRGSHVLLRQSGHTKARNPRANLKSSLDEARRALVFDHMADSRPQDPIEDGMSALEPWSVLADVAGHLQVSEDTVLRWIAHRELPGHRVGRVWRFKLTEVDSWVRSDLSASKSIHVSGPSR